MPTDARRTRSACGVCGSADVRTDAAELRPTEAEELLPIEAEDLAAIEAEDLPATEAEELPRKRGPGCDWVLLAECSRCAHRWVWPIRTAHAEVRGPSPQWLTSPRRRSRELPSAA